MTFTYEGVDESKIIKSLKNYDNVYKIEYLDGSISEYICSNSNELRRLKDIMIEQAKLRQEKFNIHAFDFLKGLYSTGAIASFVIARSNFTNNSGGHAIGYAALVTLLLSLKYYKSNNEYLKELKKYKMFLELMNDLDIINTSQFLKCVEFETMYQIPFDIDTLDEYSYSQTKIIYKEYKKLKKVNCCKQ